MKKYTITCTEEHLRLMADAIEDWCRFLSGQCEMWNATSGLKLENIREIHDRLKYEIKPLITPELSGNASYGWSGGSCPNEWQEGKIAMSYGIYRQIRHFLAVNNPETPRHDVYLGSTLTCEKQGGLIEIKENEEITK